MMKLRSFALFCLISLLFASLCGCNQGGNSDGPNANPKEKNDPRLAAATALVNEIDHLTTVQDLLQVTDTSDALCASAVPSTGALSGSANNQTVYPRDPDDYEHLEQSDYLDDFSYANEIINTLKRFKEDAIGICVSLNVWVKVAPRDDAARYRITYHEENANTVTVECCDDDYYQKATVAYDENGKLMIDAYNVSYEVSYDGQGLDARTHQIHYLEDTYIRVVFETEHSEHFSIPTLMFVDLTNKSYTTVASTITEVDDNGDPIYHPIAILNKWTNGYYVSLKASGVQILQNDREILQYHKDPLRENTVEIRLPLNNLTGWSSVERCIDPDSPDDYYVLHTDTGEHQESAELGKFEGSGYSFFISLPTFTKDQVTTLGAPKIFFSFDQPYPLSTETVETFLNDLHREFGLSLDENAEQLFLSLTTAFEELSAQTHLLDGIYADDITVETYLQLYDLLIYHKITPEDLAQMLQEDAIEKEEQYSFNANVFETHGDSNGGITSTFTIPADASVGDMVVVSP